MRRPQSAFGLVAVMSSLLVVSLFATPASAAFAPAESDTAPVLSASSNQCTKWTSQYVPPRTIRVLRTASTDAPKKVLGTVQEVDFREYVAVVMAAEWPEHYPLETLKAGAIATKQFAWYYILHPRGGTKKVDGERVCYDVVDSTVDQYYKPETRGFGKPNGPGPKIVAALDATWKITLRRYDTNTESSRFFLTGYRSGASRVNGRPIKCAEDANGWKLYHWSTQACGKDGLTYRKILRKYLYPLLEIVEPGNGQVIGTKHGDATAMKKDSGRYYSMVWTPGQKSPDGSASANVDIAADTLVDYASADMDGDGREDLVWLKQTGPSSGKIRVALSNGTNYRAAQDWWTGSTLVPLASAHLLLSDFTADQRVDAAILSKGGAAGTSRLIVLTRKKYHYSGKFNAPVQWWSGSQDASKIHSAWAGDISGDGRADLVIRQTPPGGGARIRTAVTRSPVPSGNQRMTTLKTRYETRAVKASKIKTVLGDANRDGRQDVVMLTGGNGPAKVDNLQSLNNGLFKKVRIWTAPKSDPIGVKTTRMGTADVNYNGMSDLVLYSKRANGNARIRVLKMGYNRMYQGPNWNIGQRWSSVYPY
jgi:hypothetical protein